MPNRPKPGERRGGGGGTDISSAFVKGPETSGKFGKPSFWDRVWDSSGSHMIDRENMQWDAQQAAAEAEAKAKQAAEEAYIEQLAQAIIAENEGVSPNDARTAARHAIINLGTNIQKEGYANAKTKLEGQKLGNSKQELENKFTEGTQADKIAASNAENALNAELNRLRRPNAQHMVGQELLGKDVDIEGKDLTNQFNRQTLGDRIKQAALANITTQLGNDAKSMENARSAATQNSAIGATNAENFDKVRSGLQKELLNPLETARKAYDYGNADTNPNSQFRRTIRPSIAPGELFRSDAMRNENYQPRGDSMLGDEGVVGATPGLSSLPGGVRAGMPLPSGANQPIPPAAAEAPTQQPSAVPVNTTPRLAPGQLPATANEFGAFRSRLDPHKRSLANEIFRDEFGKQFGVPQETYGDSTIRKSIGNTVNDMFRVPSVAQSIEEQLQGYADSPDPEANRILENLMIAVNRRLRGIQ